MKKEEITLEHVTFRNLIVYICGTVMIGICTLGIAFILHRLGVGFWKATIIAYLFSSVLILTEIIGRVRKNNDDYYTKLNEETNEFIKFVLND